MVLDHRVQFIGINLAVNLLMLGRSYLAMRTLDELGLGYLALAQTLILFVSALQMGMLQGGFRLLCNGDGEDKDVINAHFYAFETILVVLAAAVLIALPLTGLSSTLTNWSVVAFGVLTGAATLNRTWVSNQLIAKGSLASINRLTLATALLSLLPLAAISAYPLQSVLVSMAVQPLFFVAMALWRNADLRPRRLLWQWNTLGRIMTAGFLVFASGMMLQVGTILERWFVGSALGLEKLGELYLVILFITLFQIVPAALDTIMLPKAIEFFRNRQISSLKRLLKLFLLASLLYSIAVAAAVALLAAPVLQWLLPQRVGDLRHIVAILPGLLAFTVASPFAISFNILIDYRGYILAYGTGTLVTAAVLGLAALRLFSLDIDDVMLLRSLSYGLMGALVFGVFLHLSRQHTEFRFWQP